MWTHKRSAALTLVALATWACSADEYPSSPRFDPPPEEVVVPDGELFIYQPPAGVTPTAVSVPGEFNGWTPGEDEMTQDDALCAELGLDAGCWVAGIDLEPGTYQYKYHFNGDTWAGNMCAEGTFGNPPGGPVDPDLDECNGENAVREVGTPAPAGHTFLYLPLNKDVQVVTVAGSFQDPQWTNDTDTLDNIWTLTVDMVPGTYEYKYVFNDGDWAEHMCEETQWGDEANETEPLAVDPDNPVCVDGGNGVITITEAGPHTFRYIVPANVFAAGDSIATIHVAGSFQDPQWVNDSPATEMIETFQRTYVLPASDTPYEYKFIFDGDWGNNMCTDTDEYGDPTTGLVDANNTDGCADGGNALLVVDE